MAMLPPGLFVNVLAEAAEPTLGVVGSLVTVLVMVGAMVTIASLLTVSMWRRRSGDEELQPLGRRWASSPSCSTRPSSIRPAKQRVT